MTIEHKDIPDGQRHEPKGASTAPAGSTYVADGLGSGSWQPLTAARVSITTTPKTADYTTVAGDSIVLVDASAGAINITLIAPSSVSGQKFTVKKIDSSANPVNVIGTIDGASSQVLRKKDQAVDAVSNGTAYYRV